LIEPWLGFSSFRGIFHVTMFNALCCAAMLTHWQAMTTDPGAVPRDARPLPTDDEEFDPELAASRYGLTFVRCFLFVTLINMYFL
jgi:hypothetical protein